MDASFGTVWERISDRQPDAVAISAPGRAYTWREFDDRAARLAGALTVAGVGAGDTVACYQYNGPAYLETVFAAFKIGAVPVNANYRYTGGELASLLTDAAAAAVVYSGALAGNLDRVAAEVGTLRLMVRVGPSQPDAPGPAAPELSELLAATPPRPREPRPGSDRLFMYTGGTTGRPKGVIWRLDDLLHCLTVPIFGPLGLDAPPASVDEAVDVAVAARAADRAPVTLPVVPLMHGTGLFNTMGALLAGGRAVTLRPGRLEPRHVWETVAVERVRTVIVAGDAVARPLVDELVRADAAGAPHDLSSVTDLLSSGTAFADRLKHEFHARAELAVVDAIASSESGPFAFAVTRSAADLPSRFFPVPAAAVLSADDRLLEPGDPEPGVLAYRGPMPVGYHGDSARTATTFREVGGVRWSVPGDLARLAADGSIRFLGRGSGVVNTGGEKVHPQEVEEVLLTDPGVADAVVVGVPDETWGEVVVAVAAPVAGHALDEGVLRERVRAELAGYKVPRAVVTVDAIPRTPTGKIEVAWARTAAAEGLRSRDS
ncbi:AMP-binding protein [Pseudonocardia nematodicida]|uniref:AMP-binding protein n=1 Tax=Pseudonocardia nematodicida TaxID=1206997 RepID=A0ABV1K896_9PSEU